MRVIVAGGAGFVGSHVCHELIARGHEVTCIDNMITGSLDNVAELEGHPRFQLVVSDVARAPLIEADFIIHLASPASPVDYDRFPLETMSANSIGTWRLLEIARETRAKLTFTSTSEVYGDPLVHPQPESYWGNVDPVGPRSSYDESKRFGEALLMSMRRARGVRATIVRFFNTYGPKMRFDDGRVIPELLGNALGGRALVLHGTGSQTRSFCYVDDLVRGLLLVALDTENDGEIFNIGNPAEITIRGLAERIRDLIQPGLPIVSTDARVGDPARRCPDISKIQTWYGWQPEIDLDQGLRATIAAHRDAAALVSVARSSDPAALEHLQDGHPDEADVHDGVPAREPARLLV
jgi:nucleoside-diphosphate-sugar epimerase